MATEHDLQDLARRNSRVCPQPKHWSRVYQLLPETRQVGIAWEPPLPLILAAWEDASDTSKAARFQDYIAWAASHGATDVVHDYLAALSESDWHHAGE